VPNVAALAPVQILMVHRTLTVLQMILATAMNNGKVRLERYRNCNVVVTCEIKLS